MEEFRETIPQFYTGKDIFITGGTGFMGKVLIEKMLRSCPKVNAIYMLLRPKKDKTIEERLQAITDLPLFRIVKQTNPDQLKKIIPVNGDACLYRMGLSDEDLNKMKNVSIIFHSAASVRFDDPLKDAILLNTKGTLEVMKFAETLTNLKVLVHVSTAYCNPDYHVVEEQLYPPIADWRTAIKLAENDKYSDLLNVFFNKFSSYQPNTYTFTKSLAEQIVNEYKTKFPVVIFRPSIVVSSIDEPFAGWIDNFNGPIGMLVASGLGVFRTMHGDPEIASDYVPVDIAIKGLIIAAYKKVVENPVPKDIDVCNCATLNFRKVSYDDLVKYAKRVIVLNPFEKTIWAPGGGLTRCRYKNYLKFIFTHMLLAGIIDLALKVFTSHKPFMMKLQRRIYGANLALSFFVRTHWTFKTEHFQKVNDFVSFRDKEDFEFISYKNFDIDKYFKACLDGAKQYLLKESESCSRAGRIKYWVLIGLNYVVETIFKVGALFLFVRFVWNFYNN